MNFRKIMLVSSMVLLISLLGKSQEIATPPRDTLHPDDIPVEIPEKQADSILKGKGVKNTSGTFNSDDAKYLQDAYTSGLMELYLAKQANTKSKNNEVKEFAELMVADHAKLNGEIQSISSKNQVPLPELSEAQKAKLEKLFKVEKDYDLEFIELMIAEHKVSVDLFEKASKHSSAPDVKDFFSNALPELVKHTGMSMQLKTKIG